jgi:hypothetical protein
MAPGRLTALIADIRHTKFLSSCCRPQELTGGADGLLAAQRSPATPLQRMSSHAQEVAAQLASLKQQKKEAAGHAYLEYVLDKQLKFVSDPSNTRFEELELPELIKVRVM